MRNEAAEKAAKEAELKSAREIARRLLKLGKIEIDEISECFPGLSDAEIRELEEEVVQPV